jgi:hypothetical protein
MHNFLDMYIKRVGISPNTPTNRKTLYTSCISYNISLSFTVVIIDVSKIN